ncbi:ABC transporter substrate-binding protein [Sphingomonas japonica]|uniref:Peptide/nickel transport system substrate-binding protein n=1 Tax=Sphingomonas japonica TaxID=511662 RepID=A0ABX0U0F0_9SPHN|nr:ABC transporter substrate-binding protein [Sphingomonas japonica]NIJ22766.1 peptide/nickel transport system substrate-binding protein [Sphingomonas japonica]
MVRSLLPLLLVLFVAGCERRPDDVPVVVSAIGGPARLVDPGRGQPSLASLLLADATAQGLVRFDANGQVEPGLAERWIVIDDGRSYIFRLRAAEWADGSPVTAEQVVARLRRATAPEARNAVSPYLSAIDEIVAMTPQVIEVRLSRPRPNLLTLFAHPALAIYGTGQRVGSGPFRIAERGAEDIVLQPAFDPSQASDEVEEPAPEDFVRLRGERAAMAILRFAERESDLVTGGSFADWPLIEIADVAPNTLRIDPAIGLFGLAIVERTGFLADAANRAAIAMAIDRGTLTAAFRQAWTPVQSVLPDQLDSADVPALPDWTASDLTERRAVAQARVAIWRARNPVAPPLRVALPPGPGSNLVWGSLAEAFAAIGLPIRRVAVREDADLRLIDAVAPYESARWFLVTACRLCSAETIAAIDAARDAPDAAARSALLAQADIAVARETPFIPIAPPLRWSLVAPRLAQWQANPYAWHPLNRLRREPN